MRLTHSTRQPIDDSTAVTFEKRAGGRGHAAGVVKRRAREGAGGGHALRQRRQRVARPDGDHLLRGVHAGTAR